MILLLYPFRVRVVWRVIDPGPLGRAMELQAFSLSLHPEGVQVQSPGRSPGNENGEKTSCYPNMFSIARRATEEGAQQRNNICLNRCHVF